MDAQLLKRALTLAERYGKDVYAVISNMSIAMERRDLLTRTACFVCNRQEAGILFMEDFEHMDLPELRERLRANVISAGLRRLVVTLGGDGAVYADRDGNTGYVPALRVDVIDTTGAGDAFFAGVTIGLTYGKDLGAACQIGTRLAASVITTRENVCPRFRPEEFGLSYVEKE